MNKKKLILFIIPLIILVVIGFISLKKYNDNKSLDITIDGSADIYPKFSSNVKDYIFYTTKDTITIKCSSKADGCNKDIKLTKNETEYTIKYNDKEYKIFIVKLDSDNSRIEITDIKGIPTEWTNKATLSVSIDNPDKLKDVEYSFDGGNTYQTSNSKEITENGEYEVLVRDYFGYNSEVKKIKIDKIDSEKPNVVVNKTVSENNQFILTAEATDKLSGIKSYLWNNGSLERTLIVNAFGNYYVTVEDNAGNKRTVYVEVKEQKENNVNSNDANNSSNNNQQSTTNNSQSSSNNYIPNNNNNSNNNQNNNNSQNNKPADEEQHVVKSNYKATFIIDDGSSTNLECFSTTSTCNVVAPNGERKNYEFLGWSKTKGSKNIDIKVGEVITLNKNTTYYSVTREKLTAKFVIQDTLAVNNKDTELSCYKYNQEKDCIINTPNLVANKDYKVIGWNTNKTAKEKSSGMVSSIMTVYLKDNNTTYYSITTDKNPLKATFNIQDSNLKTTSNEEVCYRYNGEATCSIKTPTLTASSGYKALGWDLNKDSNTSSISSNQNLVLGNNQTYYSISYDETPITVTFNKNKSSGISFESRSCYKYNGSDQCSVLSPTITPGGDFVALGWNTSSSKTNSAWSQNEYQTVKESSEWFAITRSKETYKTKFEIQDSNAVSNTTKTISCYRYNGGSSCNVTVPTLNAKENATVIGWNKNKDSTTSTLSGGTVLSVTSDATYYSITKLKVYIRFSKNYTFDNNTVPKTDSSYNYSKTNIEATSLTFSETSCNSINGNGCKITTVPNITSVGNEVMGFSTTPTGNLVNVYQNVFKSDTTLYARVYNGHQKNTLDTYLHTRVGNVFVEFEKGLDSEVVNTYTETITQLNIDMPQMFYANSKIVFLTEDTFLSFISSGAGMTYSSNVRIPIVYIRIYSSNPIMDYMKGSVVHELGHVFDRHYLQRTGVDLRTSSDVTTLRNLYDTYSTKPMRSYSYSSGNGEFVADMFRFYYIEKYKRFELDISSQDGYTLKSTDAINSLVEKLSCVAKNNYDKGASCQ